MELLEQVQRKATKLIRRLEHLFCEDRLRVGVVQPGEEKAAGSIYSSLSVPKVEPTGKIWKIFLTRPVVTGQGAMV